MSGINKVILVGHVGKDPDFRVLEDKSPVLSFPLATDDFITKNGIRVEQTEWHNIVMWRGLAEAAAKLLKRGKLVFIEGKAQTRSFTDKNDVKRYITEIIAQNFTPMGNSGDFDPEYVENGYKPSYIKKQVFKYFQLTPQTPARLIVHPRAH